MGKHHDGAGQEKKRRKDSASSSGQMPGNPAAMMGLPGMPAMPFAPYMLQQQQQWAAYMAMMAGQKKKKKEKKKKKRRRETTSSSDSASGEAPAATASSAASALDLKVGWLGQASGEAPAATASSAASAPDLKAPQSSANAAAAAPALRQGAAGAEAVSGLDEFIAGSEPAPGQTSIDVALPTKSESVDKEEETALDKLIAAGSAPLAAEAEAPSRRQRKRKGWDDQSSAVEQVPEPPSSDKPAVPAAKEEVIKITNLQGGPPEKLYGDAWEEPRSQTGLKLIGEEAPPGLEWKYVLKDESRRSFVGFLPRTLSQDVCASFFEKARDGADWMQPMGPKGPIPRKTAWMVYFNCACTYRYGRIEVQPQQYPPWMCTLMQWIMPCCGINEQKDWPNSCNLNLYNSGGMSVGWHADDEQLFQGKFRDCRIISLSLGATRSFELRMNWSDSADNALMKLMLGDGDLCTMEGMCQKHLQHRVPREDQMQGPRINLTWRWIAKHTPRCPAARERA